MRPVPLTILRFALIAAALAGAFYSAVFAVASLLFRQDTGASIARAVQTRAVQQFLCGSSGFVAARDRKVALLQSAVQLNPFDVQAWIQLGFTSEFERHDPASAERYYVRAAQVDRMFLPKWTLTNFYFRQQNQPEFFRWARATLEITPYSPDPVFAQMWLITQDPRRIAPAIPDRGGVLLAYAGFLASEHQYDAVAPVVQRLIHAAGSANPVNYGRDDQIGPLEDRLLGAGDLSAARAIWQSMSQAKWVALPLPTPAHPLNNGRFNIPFFAHGFDWAPVSTPGVELIQSPSNGLFRVALSGNQPEDCILLRQYVPLERNRSYRLQWQAEGQALDSPSGLAWHLYPVPNPKALDWTSSDLLAQPAPAGQFQSGAGDLYLLTLEYTRPLGSIRATGTAILRSVSLAEE